MKCIYYLLRCFPSPTLALHQISQLTVNGRNALRFHTIKSIKISIISIDLLGSMTTTDFSFFSASNIFVQDSGTHTRADCRLPTTMQWLQSTYTHTHKLNVCLSSSLYRHTHTPIHMLLNLFNVFLFVRILLSIICNLYRFESEASPTTTSKTATAVKTSTTSMSNKDDKHFYLCVCCRCCLCNRISRAKRSTSNIAIAIKDKHKHTHTYTNRYRNRTVICTYYGVLSFVRTYGWNACTRCTTNSHPLFAIDFPIAENWLHQLRPKRQWRPLNKTTTCPGFIFYLIHIQSRRRHRRRPWRMAMGVSYTHFHCFRAHTHNHTHAGCSLLNL